MYVLGLRRGGISLFVDPPYSVCTFLEALFHLLFFYLSIYLSSFRDVPLKFRVSFDFK